MKPATVHRIPLIPIILNLRYRDSSAIEFDQSSVSDNYYLPVVRASEPLKAHNIQK